MSLVNAIHAQISLLSQRFLPYISTGIPFWGNSESEIPLADNCIVDRVLSKRAEKAILRRIYGVHGLTIFDRKDEMLKLASFQVLCYTRGQRVSVVFQHRNFLPMHQNFRTGLQKSWPRRSQNKNMIRGTLWHESV